MRNNYFRRKLMACAFLLPFSFLMAQGTVTVSGTVTDASSGDPLPGVTVLIKGTTDGTITGIDGSFTLSAPSDATIVFSSIGYSSIEVGASDAGDVSLQTDVTNLDEVVVTGLATSIKRSNLANNVSTISAQSLNGTTTGSTLDGALYGKLTGVNINSAGGAPGGQTALRLRGISSLSGNNQPLFIVDGVYISNVQVTNGSAVASGANSGREEGGSNRVSDINPEDIESIEVLKGASAAAIYGTRANAGVVIITTKRGAQGKTRVSFNQDFGFNEAQNLPGRRQFTPTTVENQYDASERAIFVAAQAAGEIFDYEKELYGETGFISDSRLSLAGGNERTQFYFNASRRDEEGIMKFTGYERTSLRLNLDHKLADNFKIGVSSNFINSEADRGPVGNENNGGVSVGYNLALTTNDWENLFPDENGVYPDARFAPVNVIFNRDKIINNEDINRIIQGANFDYTALNNGNLQIKVKGNFGLDYFSAQSFFYIPEDQQLQRSTLQGFISRVNNNSLQLNYQAFGIIDYFTSNNISLTGQFGFSFLSFQSDELISQTTNLAPTQTNSGQGANFSTSQRLTEEEDFGLIGQATANWDDKIITTVGIRLDKSNLNGDPNKYFAFPRASVALNIANFDFWPVTSVNLLKLRAAYGETGSSARFGSLYTPLGGTSVGGLFGLGLPTVSQNNQSAQLGDPNLEPETSQEFEFGLDIAFLDGKVGLELTGYTRTIKNLIYAFESIPIATGFNNQIRNDFDLKNVGYEISLNANPVTTSNIRWNTTVNWWTNEAKVDRLGVGEFQPDNEGFNLQFGSAYIKDGEPATSLANNIQGTTQIIGDVAPDFEMSWYNEINFMKNFQLNFLWHWKQGGDVLNLTKLLADFGGVTNDLDDPELTRSFGGANGVTGYVEDGTYLRLREVGLYYTLPNSVIDFAGFESVRVGVSGKNIITITDYSSYDPETSAFGPSGLSQGIEVSPFPSAKQYYFHLSLNF